jgi:hypothetical protein
MISKELFNDVTNSKCHEVFIKNEFIIAHSNLGMKMVNIYEFVFIKCKEWACKQKKVNMFFVETDIENSEINVGILYGEQHPNLNMHYFNEDNCEIKSIIKACQWILDNKES